LLLGGDPYALLADYADYIAAQDAVDQLYQDRDTWARKAIINVARSGYFSSDRSIGEYADKIWQVTASPS
jgi:starch phosphorylase